MNTFGTTLIELKFGGRCKLFLLRVSQALHELYKQYGKY